jgi:hypothetical protein
MNNKKWLLENSNIPIKFNLNLDSISSNNEFLQFPEVQYWMSYLKKYYETNCMPKIHGSHDYRFENIMGKLVQLGAYSEIESFHQYVSIYLNFLHGHIQRANKDPLSFGKVYQSYDYELIIATFLSQAGYFKDYAIQYVFQKRLNILYSFAIEKRYDIYMDASNLPGVKKEWKDSIIHTDLYMDGNIHLPTVHDIIFFGIAMKNHPDIATIDKVNVILDWIFDDRYKDISDRYGYFYIPWGSYATKAICWKFRMPDVLIMDESAKSLNSLLHSTYIMSFFENSKSSDWFNAALTYLNSFKTESERYIFPRDMLQEKKDGYWIFGSHMGMGEDRKIKSFIEIESTYWMEKILDNIKN